MRGAVLGAECSIFTAHCSGCRVQSTRFRVQSVGRWRAEREHLEWGSRLSHGKWLKLRTDYGIDWLAPFGLAPLPGVPRRNASASPRPVLRVGVPSTVRNGASPDGASLFQVWSTAGTPCSALQGITLHPTPYTLHPTPYTLHPTPYTLHPTPCRV